MRKIKRTYLVLGGILLLLLIIRILLPSIVLRYANKSLADMKGYHGHVKDIDIALYRGAYQLDSMYLNKVDSATGQQTKFFSADRIDLSVEWKALFQGAIVGELELFSPELIFTKEKAEPGQVAKDTNDFRQLLKDFMPLQVNRFEVHNGSIRYIDSAAAPVVDISLKKTYILAQNLTNTTDDGVKLPSSVTARATAYDGTLAFSMRLDALAEKPTFDLTAEIENADLVKLNDFFIAYGKFDVSKGTFGLYSEFAADAGRFKGYVKPIIKNLEVTGTEDRKDSFFQRVKEAVIEVVTDILENPKKEQVASRIPVEGNFDDPAVGIWDAVWQVLKNAFIEALTPSIDNAIDIGSASGKPGSAEEKPGLEKYKK